MAPVFLWPPVSCQHQSRPFSSSLASGLHSGSSPRLATQNLCTKANLVGGRSVHTHFRPRMARRHTFSLCRDREYVISWDQNTISVLFCDLNVNSMLTLWIFFSLSIYIAWRLCWLTSDVKRFQINQSINQSISQSINQSINQFI